MHAQTQARAEPAMSLGRSRHGGEGRAAAVWPGASTGAREAWPGVSASSLAVHDFSRIPIRSDAPVRLQAKLEVNAPGDVHEREADREADRVMRAPEPRPGGEPSRSRDTDTAPRHLQRGQIRATDPPPGAAPPIVNETLRSPGRQLDPSTRAFMESRMVHDFSRVRVHADEQATASARAIQARAYTVGRHVVFGAGEYAPDTVAGQRLLAHELTHVVQQAGGRAQPAIQRYGGGTATQTDSEAIIPVADLIRYIQAVEQAYPKDNWQEILTRLRTQYYSGFLFNQLLPTSPIYETKPGPDYDAPWKTAEKSHQVLRTLDRVDPTARKHLKARADENNEKDNPSPYIELANGEEIDLGHLLLGLDALLHPQTSWPYTTYNVPNIDVSTHVADLGIAVVWMTNHELNHQPPADAPIKLAKPDLHRYYNMSAPEQDLLGDVDAFALYHSIGKGNSQLTPAQQVSQKLSDLMASYYLGQQQNTNSVDRRWRSFMTKVGWTYTTSGTSVTFAPSVKAGLVQKVKTFADLYEAGIIGSAVEMVTFWSAPTPGTWKHADTVVDWFLAFVKERLEKEIATDP